MDNRLVTSDFNTDPERASKIEVRTNVKLEAESLGAGDASVAAFEKGTGDDPQQWSRAFKWYLTAFVGFLGFISNFTLSAPTGFALALITELNFTVELIALTISIFVAGTCVGTFLWSPLCEEYGRRPIYIAGFLLYTASQVGVALSQNGTAFQVFRLLGGIAVSAPMAIGSALLADIWDESNRKKTIVLSSITSYIGPALAPLIGGCMSQAGIHWRWMFWILAIVGGLCTLLVLFTVPETCAPIILAHKARRLRKAMEDRHYRAPLDPAPRSALHRTLYRTLAKPFVILVREPALIATNIYLGASIMKIIITCGAIRAHHAELGLVYLPGVAGEIAGIILYIVYINRQDDADAPKIRHPEAQLALAICAAPAFAISYFWLGWTSFPSISFWAPLSSIFVLGFACVWLTLSLINYTIDVYLPVVASALASSTFIRNMFGAIFPMFANSMFGALNPRWASTVVGCVAAAMIPIPILLKRRGPALRARSRYLQHKSYMVSKSSPSC
ncbi:MFS general substrate transporter [Trametes elegans]|nr:MFS general substrate transporter [Trametes elegans]